MVKLRNREILSVNIEAGVIGMEIAVDNISILQKNDALLQILDRGIDDTEAGRELPLDEAFQKITDLRDIRRNARA